MFKRINQSSREQETEAINDLGPYAVGLTKIINNIQSKRKDGIKGEFTCFSGIALSKDTIEEWKLKDNLNLDCYRSTSMSESTARSFAARAETDVLDQVILRLKIENKKSKYFICLDREDYTIYLDEQEVLLQAGLIAKIESYEVSDDGELTIFNLWVSDKMVEKEIKKRTRDYVIPVIFYSI